jgi:hypothetical protein
MTTWVGKTSSFDYYTFLPKSSTTTILLLKQLVNPNRDGSPKDMTPHNNTDGLYHVHMKKKEPSLKA